MARPRRRHGRGGAPFTGEPNGLQPGDDVGNRRSFKQTQFPPENIGNRKDAEEEAWVPNDDVGNRVDAAPTHEISGALASIDGRRRRKKGGQPHQRVGRYIVGGVNPVVAGNVQRAVEAMKEADEKKQLERMAQRAAGGSGSGGGGDPAGHSGEGAPIDEEGRRGRRRRRRRRDGREQVDGQAAQEVSERRAQRFFDFEEDDRFEYVLKSDPEQKRKDAHDAVANVLSGAGRDAVVLSRVLDDDNRPKVIVTIDEKGPAATLPEERRPDAASEPLFVLGNAALMSLNYLVNKIVNRYPDDRIRLAILPAAEEKLYLESLEEHRRQKRAEREGPTNGAAGPAAPSVELVEPAAAVGEPPAEPAAKSPAKTPAKAPAKPPAKTPAKTPAKPPVEPAAEPPEAAIEAAPAPAAPATVEEAAEPAAEAKPKRARAAKKPAAKKAAAPPPEEPAETPAAAIAADAAASEGGSDEDEAVAPSEDSGARKATKKRTSAKVSSRSRASADREEAPSAKKASAKKATTKKTAAKKSASRKKASSEE